MSSLHRRLAIRSPGGSRPGAVLLDLDELAWRTGLHPDLVLRYLGLGLVEAVRERPLGFESPMVLRLQRIGRLRRDLGIHSSALGLVLELLERIDRLEATVAELEAGLAEEREV